MEQTSLDRQIICLNAEIKRRKKVFPIFVEEGKISQEKAIYEIETMTDAYQTLTQLKGMLTGN